MKVKKGKLETHKTAHYTKTKSKPSYRNGLRREGLTSESVAFDLRVDDDPLATKPSSRVSLLFFLFFFKASLDRGEGWE